MTTLATTQQGQPVCVRTELQTPQNARWHWFWPLVLTILYFAIALPFVLRHDVWRDEAQAFLLARDSSSPWQLVLNARYEGHPLLWHTMLWGLTRVWTHPLGMQLLHLLLASGTVFLFARFAPVPALTKILFAFSYYAFFEYAMIARNYQLMLLLAIVYCVLWQRKRSSFLLQSLVLGLLAHTNIFGALIAMALFALMFWEMCCTRVGWTTWRDHYFRCAVAVLLFGGMLALAVLCMKPPADSGFATSWYWTLEPSRIRETTFAAWCGLVPIPQDRSTFWNSNMWDGRLEAQAIQGVYWIFGAAMILLLFSPRALVVYVAASAAIVTFLHVKYVGSVRHQGSLFVVLIAAAWIALAPRPRMPGYFGSLFRGLLQVALIVLLIAHVWASYYSIKNFWTVKFTNGRAVAECLLKDRHPDEPMYAGFDAVMSSVAAYMPGERFLYSRGNRWGTYTIWDQAGSDKSAFRMARDKAEETKSSVIVVAFGAKTNGPKDAEKLGAFDGSFVDENYAVYRIKPRPVATAPASRAATQTAATMSSTAPASQPMQR